MAFNINQVNIPKTSGCYLMKDSSGAIIYIGKAKDLAKRVKSYFTKNDLDHKTQELVKQTAGIEFFLTNNEVEALILEARLIQQYRPKYNIKLKDNQPYMYLKLTKETYPRLQSVRQITDDAKYFGPFPSGQARKALLLTTARLFGLRTGKLLSKSAQELYALLSDIKAARLKDISPEDYANNVRLAEMFLKGRRVELVEELERRMQLASQKQNYELALFYKQQLMSIKRLAEQQLVSLPKSYDQDVINYVVSQDRVWLQIFKIKRGLISTKDSQVFAFQDNFLTEFVQQYYLTRPIPAEIILPQALDEAALVQKYLSQLAGRAVRLTVPARGSKRKLLDLVSQNLAEQATDASAWQLQQALKLPQTPLLIDGFDISNLSGQQAVGSCVRFAHGRPDKKLYRRFKIKTVQGANDFAMIKEVVARRYAHTEWSRPDVILIDGGKGQLSFAKQALHELGLAIPVFGLAKKQEEIFLPHKQKPVILDRQSPALKLVQQVRDEAHRWAVGYHRQLRRRKDFAKK